MFFCIQSETHEKIEICRCCFLYKLNKGHFWWDMEFEENRGGASAGCCSAASFLYCTEAPQTVEVVGKARFVIPKKEHVSNIHIFRELLEA